MTYSIYVPCYNEETILKKNIELLKRVLDATKLDYTIYIVNDCSTDKTSVVAHALSVEHIKIKVHDYYGSKPTRRENLLKSMYESNSDVVAFMDCDMSTGLKDLLILLISVEEGRVVIGNRYDKDSTIKRSFKRYIISKCLNVYTRLLFLTGIKDHFIGFKAFHHNDLIKILSKMNLDKPNYGIRSMWADAEILIWAKEMRIKIRSISVNWEEAKFSKLNYKREFGIILYSLFFRVKKWIN